MKQKPLARRAKDLAAADAMVPLDWPDRDREVKKVARKIRAVRDRDHR